MVSLFVLGIPECFVFVCFCAEPGGSGYVMDTRISYK